MEVPKYLQQKHNKKKKKKENKERKQRFSSGQFCSHEPTSSCHRESANKMEPCASLRSHNHTLVCLPRPSLLFHWYSARIFSSSWILFVELLSLSFTVELSQTWRKTHLSGDSGQVWQSEEFFCSGTGKHSYCWNVMQVFIFQQEGRKYAARCVTGLRGFVRKKPAQPQELSALCWQHF